MPVDLSSKPSSISENELATYISQFRVARWKLPPESFEPAFVLIQNRGLAISTVFINDSPNEGHTNQFQVPLGEVKIHFEMCDEAMLLNTLRAAFHQIQQYLIDNELPLQGPLVYLRTGWLMFYRNLNCKKAMERNSQIESWMQNWIKDSISGLIDIPPWIKNPN